MKRLLLKLVLFTGIMALIFCISVFYVPNLSIKNSLFYSILDKHKLLETRKSPRLIFLGGSNLSFGLNSKMIEDSLNIQVINMGIQGGMGLKYICNDVIEYIRKDDIIIISPEYYHLLNDKDNAFLGTDKLLYIIFDVYPEGRKNITDITQWLHLIRLIPKYASDKLFYFPKAFIKNKIKNGKIKDTVGIYDRGAFNEYGDAVLHWNMKNQPVEQFRYTGKVNYACIKFLNNYKKIMEKKGASVYFMYSCFQGSSYKLNEKLIDRIDSVLRKELKIPIVGTSQEFAFNDSLFFNTEYHLNKKGLDLRSELIIKELRNNIHNDNF